MVFGRELLVARIEAGVSGRAPKRVFLVHGEPDAQAAIEPKIQALGLSTTIPRLRERTTLD